MDYAAIASMITDVIGGVIDGNNLKKAGMGYAAQVEKFKRFEPLEPDPSDTKLLDWQQAYRDVNSLNAGAQQGLEDQARQTNRYNRQESLRNYRKMQPYFDQLNRQIGQNAMSYSKGELPSDVVSSINRAAAQSGLQSGFGQGGRFGGSGTGIGALNLRNLGLTSMQLSQYGQQSAMEANKLAKYLSPEIVNYRDFMLSPSQGIQFESGNVDRQNEAARYLNELLNSARLTNTGLANEANLLSAQGKLGARTGQVQAIAAGRNSASQTLSGMGGGGGMSMGSITSMKGGMA